MIGPSITVLVPQHVNGNYWVLLSFNIPNKMGIVYDPLGRVRGPHWHVLDVQNIWKVHLLCPPSLFRFVHWCLKCGHSQCHSNPNPNKTANVQFDCLQW